MKKNLLVLAIAMVLAISLLTLPAASAEENKECFALIAGGGSPASAIDVGEVCVWEEDGDLYVKYIIDPEEQSDNWYITETHLHVATSLDDIPTAGRTNNPVPGRFTYGDDHDYVTNYTYVIEDIGSGTDYYIAAHAVVETREGGFELLETMLPQCVEFNVIFPGSSSYFDTTIMGDGLLEGSYNGWCVQTGVRIEGDGRPYNAIVYSSYDYSLYEIYWPDWGNEEITLENFTLDNMVYVNWIINQDYVDTSVDELGTFTFGDVQMAIWHFVADVESMDAPDSDTERVQYIIDAAIEEGEGFEPACGDKIALVFVPVDNCNDGNAVAVQINIIEYDFPCGEARSETAWATEGINEDETEFTTRFTPQGNWATYVMYSTMNGEEQGSAPIDETEKGDSSTDSSTDAPAGNLEMYLENSEVKTEQIFRGRNVFEFAVMTAKIVDSEGEPVYGATVHGQWSGVVSGQASAVTDTNGEVTIRSGQQRNPSGSFVFTVTDVTHDGYEYKQY